MLGLLILFVTNFLAGFSVYKIFFKESNWLEKIVIPQVFSLILSPIVFFLIYSIVGFDSAVYALPLVFILTSLLSIRIKQKPRKIKIPKKIIIAVLILTLILAVKFVNLSSYSGLSDPLIFISISDEIKNSKVLPPQDPCLYGNKIMYPWFPYLMFTLVSIYSGFSIFTIAPIFTVYLALIFFLTCLIIGLEYFKDKINMVFLFMIIVSLFSLNQFSIPTAYAYAFVIFGLFFLSFLIYLKNRSAKFALLSGIVASSIIYFHGYVFIAACLVLFSFGACNLIFNRKKIGQLIFLFIPLILALPYYAFIELTTGSVFLFEPFAGLIHLGHLRSFGILLLLLPFGIYKAVKKKNDIQFIFALSLITLFVFTSSFLMRYGGDLQDRFIPFIIPLTFISLYFLKDLKGTVKILLIILCIVFFVYRAIIEQPLYQQNFFVSEEYKISKWVKENTNRNDVILASPSSMYISVGERKVVSCEPFMVLPHLGDVELIKSRFSELILMYINPTQDLFKKHNISYMVYSKMEQDFFDKYDISPYDFSKSRAFNIASTYGNSTLFKVINISDLPPLTKEDDMKKLNYTTYSRWWTI